MNSRSTGKTSFENITGLKIRNKEEKRIIKILKGEQENARMKDLEIMHEEGKKNTQKIQEENWKTYDKKWKRSHMYKTGNLLAIQ